MSKFEQTYSLVPYSCIFIDASWRHFITSMLNCVCGISSNQRRNDYLRKKLCQDICSLFVTASNGSSAMVCLSARTAFDLFLRTKRFERGSEIIMSAVNIPGMIDIVREHGLIPVAWDIDADTLSPRMELFERLITERTVAVVVSHLFGKRCTVVDRAVMEAKKRGLYFVEDCAEAFDVFEYVGHPKADIVLFSFGVMKHFTAFGGAVCKVKDAELHGRMVNVYSADPTQTRMEYLRKLCTTFAGALGLNVPLVMQLGVPLANALGLDYKMRVVEMLRGFPPGYDLWIRLRKQPSVPLLILLRERLRTACVDDLRKGVEKGNFVRRLLPVDGVSVPGRMAVGGHDWLFPIVVDDADAVARRLNAMGVDAVIKATQLTVVNDADGSTSANEARRLLNHVVYLPIHKNVPYEYLRRICNAVAVVVSDRSRKNETTIWKSKL